MVAVSREGGNRVVGESMRTSGFAILALLVLAVITPPAALEAQVTAAAFDAGMQTIDAAVKAGRWKRALALLEALLAEHADAEHAISRRDEIVDIDRQCRFRIRHPAPDPNDVVSGDLLTCNLSSGKIKIRYGKNNLKDFAGVKNLFQLHTAKFAGPYTIQIKGKKYPKSTGRYRGLGLGLGPPSVWVCWDGENGYAVSFGFQQVGNTVWGGGATWTPARIVSLKGQKVIAEKEMTLARAGKPFKLKVKVGKRSIRSYYNNKPLLHAGKSAKLFGCWGFSGLRSFDEITVEGTAEPAWLQGRIDAALERKRKAYEKCYLAKASLPAWLFRSPRPTRPAALAGGDAPAGRTQRDSANDREQVTEFPGKKPGRAERRRLDHAADMIARGSYRGCLNYLRRAGGSAVEESRRAWLSAQCYAGLGEPERGLAACRRVRELAPKFLPAATLHAELLHQSGRSAEALRELDAIVKRDPDHPEAHITRFIILLRAERFDEAREALNAASRGIGPSKEIDVLRKLLVKSTRGPNWTRTYQHRSAHYIVYSDIDRRVCTDAAKVLEDAYRLYNVHLKRAAPNTRRFRVYLFSGQAGFLAHCRDALGASPVNAAGVYSPVLRQLLIWNLPDRDAMMRTVRHEGFHQYFHRVLNDPPTWLNEGLAEYYETADYRNGRWHTGLVRSDFVAALLAPEKGATTDSVEDLIRLTPRRFYSRANRTYPLAWAFVHFLLHGPRQYRHLVDLAFQGDKQGRPGDKALQHALQKLDLNAVDEQFRSYLQTLGKKS